MARNPSLPVFDSKGKRVKNLTYRDTLAGRMYERQTYVNGRPGPREPLGLITKDAAIKIMRAVEEDKIIESRSAMKQLKVIPLADVAETYFTATEAYIERAKVVGHDPKYKGVRSMRTLKNAYRPNYDNHIEPYFKGKTPIHKIDTPACTAFLRHLRGKPGMAVDGKPTTLSEGTVNSVRSTLSAILREARNMRAMNFDPLVGILDRDKPRSVVRPTYIKTKLRKDQLLAVAEQAPEGYKRALVTVSVLTGMRASEVVGLVWSDVRLDERMIYLTGSLGDPTPGQSVERELTKTGKERPIPLLPEAVAALRAHRVIEWGKGLGREGDFVFTSPRRCYHGRPVGQTLLLDEVRAAAIRAGIEKIDNRIVRRSLATWLANSDTPEHVAAGMMGHSVKTFHNVYVQKHGDQAEIDAVIAAMQGAVNA